MGEAPAKGPGSTLRELIATAEGILRNKTFHSTSASMSSRVDRGNFNFDAELGALLAGLSMIMVDLRVDDHDIHDICGLLATLTSFHIGETEGFSGYIQRLRGLRATATRAKVGSVVSPVPGTALRPVTQQIPARTAVARPVIPAYSVPPTVTSTRPRISSTVSPITGDRASASQTPPAPAAARPTATGRPMVQLRGGRSVPLPSPGPTRVAARVSASAHVPSVAMRNPAPSANSVASGSAVKSNIGMPVGRTMPRAGHSIHKDETPAPNVTRGNISDPGERESFAAMIKKAAPVGTYPQSADKK